MQHKPVYWKMRNGQLISIDDMSVDHLRNTLKMIVRNNQKPKEYVFELRGDMANEFNDSHPEDDCFDYEDLL